MQPQLIDRTDLGAGTVLVGQSFAAHHLNDVNGKGVVYENCDFSAAIITRGYFHESTFRKCKFVGTRFFDCNFRQATFDQCTFDYADFSRTVVPIPQVLANLPLYSNVRWELVHNLKANQQSIGDIRHDTALIRSEIEAEISHWKSVRTIRTGYYRKYDNFRDQATAWFHCRRLWVEKYVWGHGESLVRLVIAAFVALLILSVFASIPHIQTVESLESAGLHYLGSVIFILKLFVDLPIETAVSDNSPITSTLTVLLRYVFIGLAIPVLYKKISKR